jgi:hypothetical protein
MTYGFGPIIDSYSRADAIEDGVLIEAPDELVRNAGFRHSVAFTRAVWADCVAWTAEDEQHKPEATLQDETGRAWDVLWMARLAAQSAANDSNSSARFTVLRIPREGRAVRPDPVELRIVIGPGDRGEPVITIMRPDED